MRWQKKLNAKDWKHLKEWMNDKEYGRLTLTRFKAHRETQQDMIKKRDGIEVCYECRIIAKKLGIE